MDNVRIGIIGAGKAGFSIGKIIAEKSVQAKPNSASGFELIGYMSRSKASADEAATFTHSKAFEGICELIETADVIIIATPDSEISIVWKEIKELLDEPSVVQGKTFCHMSGSLSSEVFEDAQRYGAFACSLHPLLAIADKYSSWENLDKAYFTFEGSEEAYSSMQILIDSIGAGIGRISAEKKILYHAACVYFSNFVAGLAFEGEKLLRQCDLPEEFASKAWHSLFLKNAENITDKGPISALTGPAERADVDTIMAHLMTLGKDDKPSYIEMTKLIVKLAQIKHPDRDFSDVTGALINNL